MISVILLFRGGEDFDLRLHAGGEFSGIQLQGIPVPIAGTAQVLPIDQLIEFRGQRNASGEELYGEPPGNMDVDGVDGTHGEILRRRAFVRYVGIRFLFANADHRIPGDIEAAGQGGHGLALTDAVPDIADIIIAEDPVGARVRRAVQGRMFLLVHYLQVFRAVVRLVTVDMVNDFIVLQRTAEHLLGNEAMLQIDFFVNLLLFIRCCGDGFSHLS